MFTYLHKVMAVLLLTAGGMAGVVMAEANGTVEAGQWIVPVEAIRLAADAAPEPVAGTFGMVVVASGIDRGTLYLNSEQDYRDQRNLSIAIPKALRRELRERTGMDAERLFAGQRILVTGEARRVTIRFNRGRGYYYQTHVNVDRLDQIHILTEAP